MGFMTVTSGASDAQLRAVRGLDLSDSQADSAGSIPVTRSAYLQVSRRFLGLSAILRLHMPTGFAQADGASSGSVTPSPAA
jgi:hypothetical protein